MPQTDDGRTIDGRRTNLRSHTISSGDSVKQTELKIGNAPTDPRMTLALKCQKYPVYTEYSPPEVKFQSVSLYDQPYSPNDRMTPE